ncbi:hypothetical protein RUM43_011807 [Polyplax serrata]|uniref:Protein kinase domain-containing protein n=1 Tax=Polyplax serrata TaxID=468196 RepID=A0AAN8P2P9_POLSC
MKYEPKPDHFDVVSLLGRCCGQIGMVLLAKHKQKSLVAVKKFDLEKADHKDKEIIIMRQLKHPNVLSYEFCFVDNQSVYVVSQLCGFGSCSDLIVNHFPDGLPEMAICLILRDVLNALAYIHKKGIIHRAIRASHILVTANGKSMITGFRYAVHMVEDGKRKKYIHCFPPSSAVNLNWLSPELLEQSLDGYNEKSDIYSIGITSAELANGCVPFSDVPATLMLTEKVRGCAPQLIDQTTYPFYGKSESENDLVNSIVSPSSNCTKANRLFSDSFHQFTDLCLQRDHFVRPSAQQLQSHSFFKQIRQRHSPNLMGELLHPVMPLNESINADTDDLNTILANSDKMAEINISNVDWDFT